MIVKARMPHDEAIPIESYLGKEVNNPNAFNGYSGQVGTIVEAVLVGEDVEITMKIDDEIGEEIFHGTIQGVTTTCSG